MPSLLSGLLDKGKKKLEALGSNGSHDGKGYNKTSPPPLPAKDFDELVGRLNSLTLNDEKGKHTKAEFVGGFKCAYTFFHR